MKTKSLTGLVAIVLASLPAYVLAEDAGSVPQPADATASSDVTSGGEDAGGSRGSFNENPCWDDKCATETNACKADAACAKLVGCLKAKDEKCVADLQKSNPDAFKLLETLQNCGYKACNDPTKGTCKDNCGKFLGNNAPCNCDTACKQYGDCCQDYDALCGGGGGGGAENSCQDKCGKFIGDKAPCNCDDQCAEYDDCCPDYEKLCGEGGGGGGGADAETCVPKCSGKTCGADDGCGGKCSGTCPNGGVCTATKTCSGGTTADAGTGAADANAADGGSLADVGTTATPGTTKASASSSSSSGCTSTPVSSNSMGLALALLAVAGVVIARRRAA